MPAPAFISQVPLQITPQSADFIRNAFPPSVLAAVNPLAARARAAARAMPDAQFYGWEAELHAVQAPSLENLTQQGSCGGGSCNDSYSNSQFWNMNVACSADVYARVLYQWDRYQSAQARLEQLMANVPQAWVREMYFADTQDWHGRSTRLPTPPPGESTTGKALQWADWCIEVSRCIAIARWATNIQWCNSERTPDFYLGPRPDDGVRKIRVNADYGDPTERSAAPAELGTVACARGRDPRILDVASTDIALGTFPPDEAWAVYGGFHPQGYFRGTSPRGALPSRWTFGGEGQSKSYRDVNAGVCEWHSSGSSAELLQYSRVAFGSVWDYFNPYAPVGNVDRVKYCPTVIQFSDALRLRRGNQSGSGPFVMPTRKEDWDPVIAPGIRRGGGFLWPHHHRVPRSGAPRDLLVELFIGPFDERINPSPRPEQTRAARQFQINTNFGAGFAWEFYMPTGVRQAWWLMAHAYDIIDTAFGAVVSNAFNTFEVALNQIPNAYRTRVPAEAIAMGRAISQQNLDIAFGVASAVATGVAAVASTVAGLGPVGAIVGVVLYVVAALIMLGAALAQAAFSLGLARQEPPPLLPQITIRSAGVAEDPTDPCWLTTPQRAGGGGAAAMLPRARAIRDAALQTDNPAVWYEHVRLAIAAGEMAPPPTPPTVNKGLAFAGGAFAGLALFKILGG